MPAVIPLVVAGISAASSAYAAHKLSEANKQASQTQAGSANEALTFAKQKEAEYEAARQPYLNAGVGGLNMASALLGIQPPSTAGKTGPINPNIPTGPWKPPGYAADPNGPLAGTSQLFYGGAGRPDATVGGTAPVPGVAGAGGPVAPQAGFVTLRAPDGSQKAVPAALATFYQARGAQVIG